MCGIGGLYRFGAPIREGEHHALTRMLRGLEHRGPDGEGRLDRDGVLLGHRRLSVIDLSEKGRQPLTNETDDVAVVYNGEIYNFQTLRSELRAKGHAFKSRTDAEVLVHGYEVWGFEGLLSRLRGMFAFALADFRERRERPRLYLARDRFGIKPLYYAYSPAEGRLVFASELSALARSGLVAVSPCEEALAAYLAVGSVPHPFTALEGIDTLPAGHYWEIGSAEGPKRYWEFPLFETDPDAESEIPRLLIEAVRSHLVSDVPLGVFLSGGIDSASLVALASRAREREREREHDTVMPLTTLSVVFDEPELDERAYARAVAERFCTDHREVTIDRTAFERTLPDFWNAMDQPSVDGVNAFVVSKAARDAGLTVVLSGLGGDEVFLGYPLHKSLARLEPYLPWMHRTPEPLFEIARRVLRAPPKAESLNRGGAYWAFRGLFTPHEIEALAPGIAVPERRMTGDSLNDAIRLEFDHYLHNQLLRDTDALSMAHSIEARVPFLDHRLVEAVLRVPTNRKLDRRINKPLLLRSLPEPLPRKVWDRPKQGFTFPFARFLEEPNHRDALIQTTLEADVFDRSAVAKLWKGLTAGRTHWSRPWALVAYAAWHAKIRAAATSDSTAVTAAAVV